MIFIFGDVEKLTLQQKTARAIIDHEKNGTIDVFDSIISPHHTSEPLEGSIASYIPNFRLHSSPTPTPNIAMLCTEVKDTNVRFFLLQKFQNLQQQ